MITCNQCGEPFSVGDCMISSVRFSHDRTPPWNVPVIIDARINSLLLQHDNDDAVIRLHHTCVPQWLNGEW